FERGDVLRAERAAHRALTAAEQGAPLEVRANAYWDASRVLAESKRWAEALDLATRARVLMEELDNRRQVARLHNAYGYLCLEAVVFGDHGARQQEALAWGELGELDLAQGDVDGAVKALRAGLRALGPPRYLR